MNREQFDRECGKTIMLIILLLIGCMQQPKKQINPLLFNLLEDRGRNQQPQETPKKPETPPKG